MVISLAKLSNAALPPTLTPCPTFNLLATCFFFSGSTKILQVIVLVPSYTSNENKNFPVFLSSVGSGTFTISLQKSQNIRELLRG